MSIALGPDTLDEIVATFQRDGVVVLSDVDPRPLDILTRMLSELSGLAVEQIRDAGRAPDFEITAAMRQALARGHMTPELEAACHEVYGDLLVRLTGPIVHTSKTFHYQVKRRSESRVMLEGYSGRGKEVQALYGLHNEFTAARVLTSPSAVVCWTPLGDYEAPALHFYPGSHRLGLLANRWLSRQLDGDGIDRIGPVVEYSPKRGEVVIFHFLLMHGSGSAGDAPLPDSGVDRIDPVRVSCDLRFFPFCGVLDSSAKSLRDDPIGWIRRRLEGISDDLLQAPLLETLAYCGVPVDWPELPEGSVAHWSRFIHGLVTGDEPLRREAIAHLVNTDRGFDPEEDYQERFAAAELCDRPYDSIAALVPEVAAVRPS